MLFLKAFLNIHTRSEGLLLHSLLSVVSRVSSSVRGVEGVNFLGLSWNNIVTLELDQLGVGWGDVSGGLVWSSGSWVGVVVGNGGWLLSGAWGSRWSVHWSVSSRADFSSAVNTIWSVVSVAWWELSLWGIHNNWSPSLLGVVEFISLH